MTKLKPNTGAVLKELLKSSTTKTARPAGQSLVQAPKKKRSSWEDGFSKLVEPFDAPPPMSASEQGEFLNLVQGAFGERLSEKFSTSPVNHHFEGLFAGLSAMTNQHKDSILKLNEKDRVHQLANATHESEIFKKIEELHYHGKLSKNTAVAALKNKHLRDVDRLYDLIAHGGSLIKWTNIDRHAFRLQAANKYFSIRQPDKAKSLTSDSFDAEWVKVLRSMELDPRSFVGLARALLALDGKEKLLYEVRSWNDKTFDSPQLALANVLVPLWTACVQVRDYDSASTILKTALPLATINTTTTISLFIRYLSVLYDPSDSALRNYLTNKANPTLDKQLVDLPINTERAQDATTMNKMLDFISELQSKRLDLAACRLIALLDSHLRAALGDSASSEMISLALAFQKLQILQQKLPSHLTPENDCIVSEPGKVQYVS